MLRRTFGILLLVGLPGSLIGAICFVNYGGKLTENSDVRQILRSASKAATAIEVKEVGDGFWQQSMRSNALLSIGFAQLRAGDIEGAMATAKSSNAAFTKFFLFSQAAAAYARLAKYETARKVTDEFSQLAEKSWVFMEIAKVQAEKGQRKLAAATFQKSRQLALSISNGSRKASILEQIAKYQREAGDLDGALATVRAYSDPEQRITPLLLLATAQANSGDRNASTLLVNEASKIASPASRI